MKESWRRSLKLLIKEGDDIFFENFSPEKFIKINQLRNVKREEVSSFFEKEIKKIKKQELKKKG